MTPRHCQTAADVRTVCTWEREDATRARHDLDSSISPAAWLRYPLLGGWQVFAILAGRI